MVLVVFRVVPVKDTKIHMVQNYVPTVGTSTPIIGNLLPR